MVESRKRTEKNTGRSYDLILKVALQLFSERGYDGTSIDDIRHAAGFKSKASLYTHFKSKGEVAMALLQQIQDVEEQAVLQAYIQAGEEPLQRLTAVIRAFIEWGMTYPQEYSFCFLRIQQDLLVRGEASNPEQTDAMTEATTKLLQSVRAAGYPVRQIADAALLTMAVGLISRAVIDQSAFGPISMQEKIQQLLNACFGVIFAQPVTIPV
ncbi:MAG TPA: TetR/AcrR family transcriptional regulator [Ktedonobacteraceae bacterium]|nr:TetR/AcrR family transcriptional regulator [Ktedonobacteraceae bacterium]